MLGRVQARTTRTLVVSLAQQVADHQPGHLVVVHQQDVYVGRPQRAVLVLALPCCSSPQGCKLGHRRCCVEPACLLLLCVRGCLWLTCTAPVHHLQASWPAQTPHFDTRPRLFGCGACSAPASKSNKPFSNRDAVWRVQKQSTETEAVRPQKAQCPKRRCLCSAWPGRQAVLSWLLLDSIASKADGPGTMTGREAAGPVQGLRHGPSQRGEVRLRCVRGPHHHRRRPARAGAGKEHVQGD